jgi:hypothetical protein
MKRAAVVVGVLVCMVGAAAAAVTWKTISPGTHRVAHGDASPGTYRSAGGAGCHWARLRSFDGRLGAILAKDNPVGPALVTILPTDKGFDSHGCGTWTSNLKPITKSRTRFAAGTYLVKVDIAPGTYRAPGGLYCYWARLEGFTGNPGDVLANDDPVGQTSVTIGAGDRGFTSRHCGTWAHV